MKTRLLYAFLFLFTLSCGGPSGPSSDEEQSPDGSRPGDAEEVNAVENKTRLNDIWGLQKVEGSDINASEMRNAPMLEINIGEKRVMGSDGCNRFTGRLTSVSETDLVFGPLAATKMACPDMAIPDRVLELLKQTSGYRLSGLELTLLNTAGEKTLTYRKAD